MKNGTKRLIFFQRYQLQFERNISALHMCVCALLLCILMCTMMKNKQKNINDNENELRRRNLNVLEGMEKKKLVIIKI